MNVSFMNCRDECQFLEIRLSLSFLVEVLNSSLFLVMPPPPDRSPEFLVVVDNALRYSEDKVTRGTSS